MRMGCMSACVTVALACSAFGQQPAGTGQGAGVKQSGPSSTDANKTAASKAAGSGTADKKLEDLLESKIQASWEAFKKKDKKAYAEFLADDFMAVEEDGKGERTKTQVLREVDQSVVHDFRVQLFRMDRISADAVLMTYENFIQFPPGAGVRFERIFISEIWVKRNGEWKSWRYQATKVK